MSDWHTWLRHHFFLTAEQPGGYQNPRKHTVMGVSRDYKIKPKRLLLGYDCPLLSVFLYSKRPKQQMVHNHAVCSGQIGQTNWKERTGYHLLVYVGLTPLNIPLRWIDFSICDQSGVELIQVDTQPLRFVMIVYSKVGYDGISTRTYF